MIGFVKAADLRKKYEVKGRFYLLANTNSKIKCRSLLTITDRTRAIEKKLLVIMLNPGSSRPLDNEYLESRISKTQIGQLNDISLTDARPDATQYQIMRVMDEFEFSHADIINLYDVREPKSGILFARAKKHSFPKETSIFTEARQSELNTYFTNTSNVILAWGRVTPIAAVEEMALEKISKLVSKVLLVRGTDNVIYHPSPQNHKLKLKWLENIFGQLRSSAK
jgi:hypothetical protein